MRAKSVCLLSLTGVILLLIHRPAIAQERLAPILSVLPSPTFSFGMIGIGTGQTARLNVVNLVRTAPPVAISIAQVPCKVELDFYDGQGKLIQQKTVANLGFGQADFLDLVRSQLNSTLAHVDVSAVVKVGSTQSYFCNVNATLEVFDNVTGATTAILSSVSSSSVGIFSAFAATSQASQQ